MQIDGSEQLRRGLLSQDGVYEYTCKHQQREQQQLQARLDWFTKHDARRGMARRATKECVRITPLLILLDVKESYMSFYMDPSSLPG